LTYDTRRLLIDRCSPSQTALAGRFFPTGVIDPQLLPSGRQMSPPPLVVYPPTQFNLSRIIASAAAQDVYFDATDDLSVDDFEVSKINKLTVGHQIEIAAIVATREFDVRQGLTKIRAQAQ
jgi:hypothetical protein